MTAPYHQMLTQYMDGPKVTSYLLRTIREHLESSVDETLPVSDLFEQIMPIFEAAKNQVIPIKRQQDLVTFLKVSQKEWRQVKKKTHFICL